MIDYHLWPTDEQKLLLRAALAPDRSALEAIASWHERVDLGGTVDSGSFRLLPLVHANLEALGCGHPVMAMLAGVRKRAWVEAKLRDRFAIEVLRDFADRGIDTIVTKGLALAHSVFPDPSLRPMSDVDLLVAPASAESAVAGLQALGFKTLGGRAALPIIGNAVHLHREGGQQIDLHIAPFTDVASVRAQSWIWSAAIPLQVGDVSTLRACDSDMLLHVIVHGLRANPVPPLRWVADAAMIMRRGHDLDWDRVLYNASKLKVALRLRIGLDFLLRDMDLAIPAGVLDRLRGTRPSIFERLEIGMIDSRARPGWAARWGWRAGMTGRMISSGQIGHLRRQVVDFLGRRLGPSGRRA
ncbi:MAG TPA: nucleotidyltransferase family protein [Allosphingosinicella sp.]|nr:nucleotidyltransferase family protein [Allosphingosinicella sp.]